MPCCPIYTGPPKNAYVASHSQVIPDLNHIIAIASTQQLFTARPVREYTSCPPASPSQWPGVDRSSFGCGILASSDK
jgi:hypothetical protein